MASGFYADPKKIEPRSQHTPIQRSDVHFWTEVHLGAGTWQTVEPTPGYEVLAPPPGIGEQLAAAALVVWRFVSEYAVAVLLALAARRALRSLARIAVLDALHMLTLRVCAGGNSRIRVLQSLRLLERAHRLGGARASRLANTGGVVPSAGFFTASRIGTDGQILRAGRLGRVCSGRRTPSDDLLVRSSGNDLPSLHCNSGSVRRLFEVRRRDVAGTIGGSSPSFSRGRIPHE